MDIFEQFYGGDKAVSIHVGTSAESLKHEGGEKAVPPLVGIPAVTHRLNRTLIAARGEEKHHTRLRTVGGTLTVAAYLSGMAGICYNHLLGSLAAVHGFVDDVVMKTAIVAAEQTRQPVTAEIEQYGIVCLRLTEYMHGAHHVLNGGIAIRQQKCVRATLLEKGVHGTRIMVAVGQVVAIARIV